MTIRNERLESSWSCSYSARSFSMWNKCVADIITKRRRNAWLESPRSRRGNVDEDNQRYTDANNVYISVEFLFRVDYRRPQDIPVAPQSCSPQGAVSHMEKRERRGSHLCSVLLARTPVCHTTYIATSTVRSIGIPVSGPVNFAVVFFAFQNGGFRFQTWRWILMRHPTTRDMRCQVPHKTCVMRPNTEYSGLWTILQYSSTMKVAICIVQVPSSTT